MRFLSDILAKAGLIVDGAAVFNSTATGQTAASNDNSTKFATTAWVRTFVQPYTLPIASATILGGVKVGTGLAIDAITGVLSVSNGGVSIKASQTFTATAGQTIFTINGGYTAGLIDVFLNGIYLSPGQIVATNGTTVTLNDAASAGDIIDVIITSPISNGSVANTDNLPEGLTNLYYTSTRVRSAISLSTTGVSGAATYNILTGQLNIPNYQGLVPAGGIAGQILSKVDGTDYNTQWLDEAPAASYTSQLKHRVKSSQAITKGQAVYVSSADGTNMIISKASNASEGTSSKTMGLLESTVSVNGTANVITEGLLAGLDTTGATAAGDPVWLGTDGNLIYGLVNKPVAPAHLVFIGVVTRRNANNGEIFVKVQNGFEFGELHDYVQNGVQDNYVISYESATSLYKPKSIATLLGYTPVTNARTITINGVAYDLSADRSWSIAAGVTSFNTRTGAITLTSADVTGALTYTPVTNARTLTINGTTYDLSADRTWSIATSDATKLPLSGGTLTGALSGTSAAFSGAVSVTIGGAGISLTGAVGSNSYYVMDQTPNSGKRWRFGHSGAIGGFSSFDFYNQTDNITALTLASTGAATFSSSVTAQAIYATDATGSAILTTNGGGEGILSVNTANPLRVLINGGEKVRITPSGNFGIGTTSANARLDLGGGYGANGEKFFIYNDNTTSALAGTKVGFYMDRFGLANNSTYVFPTSAANPGSYIIASKDTGATTLVARVTVLGESGNLGIANTVPSHKLHVGTSGALGSWMTAAFQDGIGVAPNGSRSAAYLYSDGSSLWGLNAYDYGTGQYKNVSIGWGDGTNVILSQTNGKVGINTTNPLTTLHVNGETRTTGLRLNANTTANQGHRIYSRTMDVSAYTSQTSMRFTVAAGNSVQFQYEITFHATRLSGTLAEIWYLRYTGGIAYDTAGNPNERWYDLREQAGNGIAGVGRNNNTGNLEITNSAFDTSCRLTVCVKITCNNWDAVTVSFS